MTPSTAATASQPTIWLLNSPILTGYGDWRLRGPLSLQEARQLVANGFTSAIGHASSAELLSLLLEIPVPVNRQTITMQPGDQALVLRVTTRLAEGVVLDAQALQQIPWELSVLTRVSA